MKEKGFTLIELLAVIVILAIIALIAVPIVLNIINDARESANMRSRELYAKAVQNEILRQQMNGEEFPDGVYSKGTDGRICNTDPTPKCITVEVEGAEPVFYEAKIAGGKIVTYSINLSEDPSQLYTLSDDGKLVSYEPFRKAIRAAIIAAGGDPANDQDDKGPVDGDYYVDADGNLQNVRTGDLSSDGINETITLSNTGAYPKNGFIAIKGSKIVAEQYSLEDPICTYYEDDRLYNPSNASKGYIHSIRKGAKYVCKVNDTESYTFYIVTNNDTKSNGNDNFDLIAEDALGETTTWGTSAELGPVNAMEQLALRTSSWKNIPYIDFNQSTYSKWNSLKNGGSSVGYQSLSITNGVITITNHDGSKNTLSNKTRARLLTHYEANSYLNCDYNNNSCYSWLNNNSISYWILDNNSSDFGTISFQKKLSYITNASDKYYLVPVISLPKTAMDWTHKVRAS